MKVDNLPQPPHKPGCPAKHRWERKMEKRVKNNEDIYKWSKDTVQALRAGNFAAINVDELIDEVESIAGGYEQEMASLLKDMIEARLVLTYVKPDSEEAIRSLVAAQGHLRLLCSTVPSLRAAITDAVVDEAYQWAKSYVTEDYGVTLSDRCPFPLDLILEDPYPRLAAEGRVA